MGGIRASRLSPAMIVAALVLVAALSALAAQGLLARVRPASWSQQRQGART